MKSRMWVFLASLAAFAVTNAAANETALQKCRLLAEANVRLACYDAIVLPALAATPTKISGANPGANSAAPTNAVAGTVVGAKAASTASTNTVTSAATKTVGATDTAADFGLPSVVRAAQLEQIESSIPGRFASWQTGSRISLANGQVWQVIDDSRGICECDNPKVIVSRGSFGTFFLDIEGKGNSPRVRRIK
ncbi:MAG: hypothetical protein WCL29_05065 [Pseudomonadota bacterium]